MTGRRLQVPVTVADRTRMEPLIGTEEVSKILGLSARTIYSLVNRGDLPAYRLGRLVKFKPAEVRDFVEASRIGG